jgi:ferrous iron transport protein A
MPKPLSQLKPNTKAIITDVKESDIRVQLLEMGFVPDEGLLLEIVAPLGDPISIMIAGYNISIRKTDADNVMVEEIMD